MPALLLTFILASILLSPVQGPLGIANSALVLASMAIVGIAIDLGSLRAGSGQRHRELKPGTSRSSRSGQRIVIPRSHAAVSATPCSMVYGSGPQIASVALVSNRYCVSTLLRRNELNGKFRRPIAFTASPQ